MSERKKKGQKKPDDLSTPIFTPREVEIRFRDRSIGKSKKQKQTKKGVDPGDLKTSVIAPNGEEVRFHDPMEYIEKYEMQMKKKAKKSPRKT